MINRDIYTKDPSTWKLANDGVANVNYEYTPQALEVLRYELETFVCEGQYGKGLQHILDSYLKDIHRPQQQAVWVSGFFGSGKSHLVKILRALWIDTKFADGATARGITNLPQAVHDLLKELSTQAKRYGGVHAASGTLGAAAGGSVRLALLRIVFQSCGLPEKYPVAKFIMWLKKEGIYDRVHSHVEQNGYSWQEELDNFYVAEGLHEALVQAKPNLFSSSETCVETLNNLYPFVQDVSNEEMVGAVRQALTRGGKFPLTLIILDEVQQYIGYDSQRSMDVQETVEACCKNIGGKLLFIGAGQTAVTGTENLQKLAGRFTRRIELSDADVEAVIRQVILAKKPNALLPIEEIMQNNLGEISRHLADTTIRHKENDLHAFAQDYPIIPVRNRFWENTLRVLDPTGTESQLRNQLSMIHKAIQTNLDNPLGHVIPADYLYFDAADRLLQSRMLPRRVHEQTMHWLKGSPEDQLIARACGLIFLINKLSGANSEIGIKATINTIADLMVEDLSAGSSALRSTLPALLDKCELLIKVGDEYRIQTEESAAWQDEFMNQRSQLSNQPHRVDAEREERIRAKVKEKIKNLSLAQGIARVAREMHTCFDAQLPGDKGKKIYIWIRSGWAIDENSVRVDARQAGNESSTVFVFIPKRSADDLRQHIIDYKAAGTTLDNRGAPDGPEGTEARAAMETIRQTAGIKIDELLDETFSFARVFQGGGNEIISGNNLPAMINEAAGNAVQRLYNQFHLADNSGWDKVYTRAKQGAPDGLKAIGFDGEPHNNPVCKAILASVVGGKKGAEIRAQFETPPYGWSRDTVDGALQVLLVAGLVRVHNEQGLPVIPQDLERKAVGKATFKIEATTVTTPQRIQIRKLLQKLDCPAKSGEESAAVPAFLQKMQDLANRAGGAAPRPERPSTTVLEEIRLSGGNEQLLAFYNHREALTEFIEKWTGLAEAIEKRLPSWEALQDLLSHANKMEAAVEIQNQAAVIEKRRLLLSEPDPVQPLLGSLENLLRNALTALHQKYTGEFTRLTQELTNDPCWRESDDEQRRTVLETCGINDAYMADLQVGTREELLQTLAVHPLHVWEDRTVALKGRFIKARELAARALEPETRTFRIPQRILKNEADVDSWLTEVKEQLKAALQKGPVMIQ